LLLRERRTAPEFTLWAARPELEMGLLLARLELALVRVPARFARRLER
jgi:hypothetical protein